MHILFSRQRGYFLPMSIQLKKGTKKSRSKRSGGSRSVRSRTYIIILHRIGLLRKFNSFEEGGIWQLSSLPLLQQLPPPWELPSPKVITDCFAYPYPYFKKPKVFLNKETQKTLLPPSLHPLLVPQPYKTMDKEDQPTRNCFSVVLHIDRLLHLQKKRNGRCGASG